MQYAAQGKILNVDLTHGEIKEEILDESFYKKYLSGLGLASKLLYERIPCGADPLGEKNILAFVAGMLTCTGSFFSGRFIVAAKSPLTGTFGDSNCGGHFAPSIKWAGYDGIFFTGISKKPVYLNIKGSKVELLDAGDLWGQDATQTEIILKERHKTKKSAQVVSIGQAGEKLSLISGICTDRGRIAARSGLGAVMGSKRLKAIVVNANKEIQVFDRTLMKALSIQAAPKLNNTWAIPSFAFSTAGKIMAKAKYNITKPMNLAMPTFGKFGTAWMNQFAVNSGDSPLKNWLGSALDWTNTDSSSVAPAKVRQNEVSKYHCYSCPLGCGGTSQMPIKYRAEFSETHKPEYETFLSIGGLCLNKDADSIYYINELLNRAGMDSISAGATVAFAIECFENKLLSLQDTDGLELKWGNSEAIVELIKKMIKREGVGDLLADGSKIAAKKIGSKSEDYTIHAGGQELGMHDGRADAGFNTHYAVEPTPGKHTTGAHLYFYMYSLWKRVPSVEAPSMFENKKDSFLSTEKNIKIAASNSKFLNFANCLGLCEFGLFFGVHNLPVFEYINAASGYTYSPEEYMNIGHRIQTIRQLFNIKQGIAPKDLKPSKRALGIPALTEGPNKNNSVDIEKNMQLYWSLMGYDNEGRPTKELLQKLEILDLIEG